MTRRQPTSITLIQCLGAAVVLAPGTVLASASAREARLGDGALTLPAQPLGEALHALALHARVSIVFRSDIVAGRRIGPQRLRGTPEAMAAILLRGTGLRLRRLTPASYVIERGPTPEPVSEEPQRVDNPEPAQPIVVTALRRPTLLDDTPVSMVALGGAQLDNRRARRIIDLTRLAPSLTATSNNPGFERLSLRGVYAAGEATVGVYYGNAAVTGPGGSSADPGLMTPSLLLVDVDQVEVLRGPQGTLFGAGSLAGTVRILFRRPELTHRTNHTALEVSVQKGGATSAFLSSVVNLPFAQGKAAVRLIAYRRHVGGRIDEAMLDRTDVDRWDETGARLALRWQPDDNWRFDLTLARQHDAIADGFSETLGSGHDESLRRVITPYASNFSLGEASLTGSLGGVTIDANVTIGRWTPGRSLDFTQPLRDNAATRAACMRYFALSTPCSDDQRNSWNQYIGAQLPVLLDQPLTITMRSAEVRLSGNVGLHWTAGLFLSNREDGGTSAVRSADPVTGYPVTGRAPLGLRRFTGRLDQYAAFGDVSWPVSSRIELSAGARAFHYRRRAQGNFDIVNVTTDAGANGSHVAYRYRASGVIARLQADYRPHDGLLFYAQIAQGFRPGGINILPSLAPELAVYKGDRLTSFETGTRIGKYDGPLSLDGTLFHLEWADMQYSATVMSGAYALITNLGKARINGVEAGLTLRPTRALVLRGNLSWTDARLAQDQFNNVAQTGGMRGDRLPFVAPLAFTASLSYTKTLAPSTSLRGEIVTRYQGRFNSVFDRLDPLNLRLGGGRGVDLRLTYARGLLEVAAFVDNVTNDRQGLLGGSRQHTSGDVVRETPRTLGVSVSHRF